MSGPDLPEPDPVPEAESITAARQASEVRRRRARGGRARLILDNARSTPTDSTAAPRAPGGFVSQLGSSRGRSALVNL